MGRVILGSFLAAMVLFVWGAVFWATSLSEGAQARAPSDSAVTRCLEETLPVTGTYLIPQTSPDGEGTEQREEGPYALIHYRRAGTKPMSAAFFLRGFLQQWGTFFLIGLLLSMVVSQLPSWTERTGFVAVIGLALAVWTHLGNLIWFHLPADFPTMVAVYDLLAWVMGGAVLASIIVPADGEVEKSEGVGEGEDENEESER